MSRLRRDLLWIMLLLLAAGGSSCPRRHNPYPPPPAAFAGPASLEQVVYAVNANSSRVQQLQTETATLSIQGAPAQLRANMALERPRRLRMRAEFSQLTGLELDLGSNDELFWFWLRRAPESAIYYARHDEFLQQLGSQPLPLPPSWLIEALGLVEFDPQGSHQGPSTNSQGNLEILSQLSTSAGVLQRTIVVHPTYGWVLEQHVRDQRGQLLASARASQHRFYPSAGVSLPQQVEIQLAPGRPEQLAFRLEVESYQINSLSAEPLQLWTLPQIAGARLVNLGGGSPTGPLTAPWQMPPTAAPSSTARVDPYGDFRPRYRGDTWR